MATTKGIVAKLVGDLMQAVVLRFGANGNAAGTVEWLTDNGSCYTAAKTHTFAQELVLKPVTRWMHSPQGNAMAKCIVRSFKGDYADLAHRPDAQTVMRKLSGWFEHYNTQHPHSALGCLLPKRFREKQAVNYCRRWSGLAGENAPAHMLIILADCYASRSDVTISESGWCPRAGIWPAVSWRGGSLGT